MAGQGGTDRPWYGQIASCGGRLLDGGEASPRDAGPPPVEERMSIETLCGLGVDDHQDHSAGSGRGDPLLVDVLNLRVHVHACGSPNDAIRSATSARGFYQPTRKSPTALVIPARPCPIQ